MLKTRKYVLHLVEYVEDMIPDMYVFVTSYTPHSTPWDYYGMKRKQEWEKIMAMAGIDCHVLETRKKDLAPSGTGPGGRVRFGDNMIPSEYRLVVRKHQDADACKALEFHRRVLDNWIRNDGPLPILCR